MVCINVNGNTTTRNRQRCIAGIVHTRSKAEFDSVGRVMVPMPKGGMVVFFASDEPSVMMLLGTQGRV